jgi:HK97 family phage portal protein
MLCLDGYTTLNKNPEIVTAVRRIADLVSSMTIYLMSNTASGDERITNELSRKIDIDPCSTMTRSQFIEYIVMNMLLYGKGNAIILPHTWEGYIKSLEPVAADRVQLLPRGASRRDYDVYVDGIKRDPANLLHCVYNPDKYYPWRGAGLDVQLKDVAKTLKQARTTENAFMASKWKPSIIVKVDSMVREFQSKEGRQKVLDDYVKSAEAGEPWLIPGEQFQVEQVRPLSLADLAINDTVELDRRTVAAILGVPGYLLGVGDFNRQEWNLFIQTKIASMAKSIMQEFTKKLIINPRWYLKFNTLSLMNYDIQSIYTVFGGLRTQGVVTGNEVREMLGMSPIDDESMDELIMLENYIPADRIGDQEKLNGGN